MLHGHIGYVKSREAEAGCRAGCMATPAGEMDRGWAQKRGGRKGGRVVISPVSPLLLLLLPVSALRLALLTRATGRAATMCGAQNTHDAQDRVHVG